jgi:hypothetical protein
LHHVIPHRDRAAGSFQNSQILSRAEKFRFRGRHVGPELFSIVLPKKDINQYIRFVLWFEQRCFIPDHAVDHAVIGTDVGSTQ